MSLAAQWSVQPWMGLAAEQSGRELGLPLALPLGALAPGCTGPTVVSVR